MLAGAALPFCLAGAAQAGEMTGTCAPAPQAREEVVNVVHRMYAALRTDDLAAFQAQVTPDYYAFDLGSRFTAESLVGLIKSLHAQGLKFDWNVNTPDVHVACNEAWLAYTNTGWVESPKGERTTLEWVESANLVFREGAWRIQFFHSTQVPSKPGG